MTQKRKGTERELPAEGRREKVGESETCGKLHWVLKLTGSECKSLVTKTVTRM